MTLSSPTKLVFFIALVLGVLGVAARFVNIPVPFIEANAFWMVAGAWVLLTIGTLFKGI